MERRTKFGLLFGMVLGVFFLVWVRLNEAGAFRSIEPEGDWNCSPIPSPLGPEDLTWDPLDGALWVSALDRRTFFRGGPAAGGIFRYTTAGGFEDRTPKLEFPFHPHGIDLWVDARGARHLAAVNHRSASDHTIEFFREVDGIWRLERTIIGGRSPNDVAVGGHGEVWVTQDHRTEGAARLVEEIFSAKWSTLSRWSGEEEVTAHTGLAYPNGVQVSADGRRLYLTQTLARTVSAYEIQEDQSLSMLWMVELEASPDNVELDEHGDLWIAAHPNVLAFLRHARSETILSPSQVWHVSAEGRATPIWQDDGALLSGSSAAAVAGGKLAVGAVFSDHILLCRRP